MPKIYQVRVKDTVGALTAIFTGERKGYFRFYYRKDVNTCGAFSMAFAKMADETEAEFISRTNVFVLDGTVEFWWRWEEYEIDWRLDAAYFVRDTEYYLSVGGKLSYEAMGRGFLDLLNRRVIERGTTVDSITKDGTAETVFKEFVTEQAILGGSAWSRETLGLTVEADQARGPVVHITGLNRVLYQVLYNGVLDTGCFYDVIQTGDAEFEFRWYSPTRGTDRTEDVRFAYDLGNMTQASLAIDRHDEITAVLVGGRGTEADRDYVWRTDDVRIAASPWNRIEQFMNGSNANTVDEYNDWGDRRLSDMRPRETLRFVALQTPGSLFGKHYFYGDLVASEFMGHSQDKVVSGFAVVESPSRKDLSVELQDA